MTKLLLQRADEVAPGVPRGETSLIIVGHGTSLNENSRKVIEQQVALIRDGGYGFAEVVDAYMEEKPSTVAPANKIKAVSASVPLGQGFALRGVYQARDNGVGADVDVYTVAVSKDVSKRTRLALVYQDQTGKGINDFVQAQVIHSF
jgi:hypothetical protein